MTRLLPRSFFARDAVTLARDLLGRILAHDLPEGRVAGRIVEVEAYRGPADLAAHTARGRRTPRNEVMWGPPGHAYVYFVYGMHYCANVVAAVDGVPEAVLIRAVEPLEGIDILRARRGGDHPEPRLAAGPANLCRAFGIDRDRNGADLLRGPLTILPGTPVPPARRGRTRRIGVDYAGEWALRLWRFIVKGSPSLSGPPALRR